MSSKRTEWKQVRGTWISPEPVLPGVWERRDGGHVVRTRVIDPATGHQHEIWKVLPQAGATSALQWLDRQRASIRLGGERLSQPRMRFSEFAASHFEHKVKVGEIRSAKGRAKWAWALTHLISGTIGQSSNVIVLGFGDVFLEQFRARHFEDWQEGMAELIALGEYAPTTVNDWIAILRVVGKAAMAKYVLPLFPLAAMKSFDTSEHATYTEEEPNALRADEVGPFLERLRELYPGHFGMAFLGMVTGLRPSSLRPLRRRGPEPDVLWDVGRLLVRRSHSLGLEVMNTTKQKHRYTIDLPHEVMGVLRWHVDTQLVTPEQLASDLLFPSITGGFRSPSVLSRPFAAVAERLGLGKGITPRALRRTFNDLARQAKVDRFVIRSISGHLTEEMQEHYSTVDPGEQREAVGRVVQLSRLSLPMADEGV